MTRAKILLPAVLMAVGLASASPAVISQAQSNSTIQIIAIDANPTGNTATSLGPLNACVRTEPGSDVTVDLIVDAVPGPPDVNGIVGFEISVDYSPALLAVSAYDYEYLLAAVGSFEPFEALGDPVPDTDGTLNISVADLAVNNPDPGSNTESGPGVLARITLRAEAAGIATVTPVQDANHYPNIINQQNNATDVDSIAGAQIAIGQDCPVPPDSTPVARPIPHISDIIQATPTPPPAGTQPTPGATATSAPGTGAASGSASPGPSATPRSPTPTPTVDGAAGTERDSGSSTGTVIAVIILALAGLGLTGAGGFVLYRRAAQGS